MATYGTRDATQFTLPSVESNEKYYTLVDRDTGKITLKRIVFGSFTESLDATVGTIETSGSNAGKFVAEAGASPTEKKAFAQQPQAIQTVKNKATETVTKAKITEGTNPQVAQDEANRLISPNASQFEGQLEVGDSNGTINTQFGSDKIRDALGGADIIYPTDLRTNGQDCIKFEMVEYGSKTFRAPSTGTTNFSMGTRDLEKSIISAYLPIQPSISDQNDIGWGEEKMNIFQTVLANIATTGSQATLTAEIDQIQNVISNTEYQNTLRRYFGGQAVGINPIARTDGLVLNPNLELLFSGPSLRPFNFTFRLSPRDSDEALKVKRIIKFFKLGSVVRTTTDGLFLKAPNVFKISYVYKEQNKDGSSNNHPGLNKIKTCALRTVNVNYTPDGSYMTFEDGTMTSYEVSLQFCELEPVYDKDYFEEGKRNNLNHPIGF